MTTPAAAPALMAPDLVAAFDALLCEGGGAPALPREWHILDMAHGRVTVAMVVDELAARAACETWNGREGRERFKVVHVPAMVPQPCQLPQAQADTPRAQLLAQAVQARADLIAAYGSDPLWIEDSLAHELACCRLEHIQQELAEMRDASKARTMVAQPVQQAQAQDMRQAVSSLQWSPADSGPINGMSRRASRYRVRAVCPGSYDETTAYSRRVDALKRANVMVENWFTARQIMVLDTYTGETIFEFNREPADLIETPDAVLTARLQAVAEDHPERVAIRAELTARANTRGEAYIDHDGAPRLKGCVCSGRQLSQVGCDCELSGEGEGSEMVPQPSQEQQARHQPAATPQLPPVIDDAPRPAFVLTPEQSAFLDREERAAAADCRAREAVRRQDAVILMACALAVLAVLATLVMAGPRATAQAAILGPVHVALALAAPRAPPAAEAVACGRVAGMGEHVWQVEAARLTASTGARSTVSSLRATCAPAAR